MRAFLKLIRLLKPYWHWATLAPLMMVVEVTMDLLQPRLVQRIIDQGIAHSNGPLILHTGALMLCAAIIGLGGGMGCTYFSVLAGQAFGADLRGYVFRTIQSLSFGNIDKLETGTLITRLTNDVSQVMEMVTQMLRVMVRMPLMLVGSLIMAIVTCPKLAVLFVVLIPIVSTALVSIINRTYPMYHRVQSRLDGLNTVLQENLTGVRVVRAFARSEHESRRFRTANDGLMERNTEALRLSAVTMPFMMLCVNAGIAGTVWLGGLQVGAGELKTGQLVAFVNYLMQTMMSLVMVSMLGARFSRAEASAQRIDEVLSGVPEVTDPAEPVALPQFGAGLRFENVSFKYEEDEQDPVLKNISFSAAPGEMIAIIGSTGAGKSSLVNLIPRFYDTTEGRITLNDVDVRDIHETELRHSVGLALQETVLFSGTIRENITYARPSAEEWEVAEAARAAQAEEFILGLPEGYETVVGQRGVNLSGGQKQRIGIARALLARPDVLILDDSTSAVDVRTESRIHRALVEQRSDQTLIVVAQRISTVINADKILVVDDGRLVAEGAHSDLLYSSPIYREIYESQTEIGVIAHD